MKPLEIISLIFFLFIGLPEGLCQNPNAEEDPLPNEDNSISENTSNNGQSHTDLVTINVQDDENKKKQLNG